MSFGSSAEKMKKPVKSDWTYRPRSEEYQVIRREKEEASDKISDLPAKSDEFQNVSQEKEKASEKISALSDEFRIICREKEKADDKISELSVRSEEFWIVG